MLDKLSALGLRAWESRIGCPKDMGIGRLRSSQQIFSSFGKKRGQGNEPGPAVHDDLVKRKITATAANKL